VFSRELTSDDLNRFGAQKRQADDSDQRVWVRYECAVKASFRPFGESAEEGLRREVREEVGLELDRLTFLASFPNISADRRTLDVIPGAPPDLRRPLYRQTAAYGSCPHSVAGITQRSQEFGVSGWRGPQPGHQAHPGEHRQSGLDCQVSYLYNYRYVYNRATLRQVPFSA